jgi:basic amino acid/polyamine antiporter, APA family
LWQDGLVAGAHAGSVERAEVDRAEPPRLLRRLGSWDGALITVGAMLGSGIFLTTGDIARRLPHAGLILVLWVAGGLLTLAGALTYAELGTMYPRAGGQYHFLKEAYGRLWGFLFGWTSFFVIMTGGLATIAVGFGEYLGAFLPLFSSGHVLARAQVGPWTWTLSGGQLGGALALALLTAVNYAGLRHGAMVQNLATACKILLLLGLATLGLAVPPAAAPDLFAPLPASGLVAGLGLGMVAVLWTYDGWYVLTFSAGEMRAPERTIPRGLVAGVLAVAALYLVINWVYLRALPPVRIGETTRVAEAAASSLFGARGAHVVSFAVLLATFGCLASNVLCCARIYLPMAEDGLFFGALARIHPRHHTPSASLLAQGAWGCTLALSGTFEQLYTCVVFAGVLFHAATGASVFVLRRTRPDVARPYRAWGYPVVPAAFVAACLLLVGTTLAQAPAESLVGLGLVATGLPAYAFWQRRWQATVRSVGTELGAERR